MQTQAVSQSLLCGIEVRSELTETEPQGLTPPAADCIEYDYFIVIRPFVGQHV